MWVYCRIEKIAIISVMFEFFKYAKFTRVQCSSSGVTCPNAKCNVILKNRTTSFMNLSCDLKFPIKKFYVKYFLILIMISSKKIFSRLQFLTGSWTWSEVFDKLLRWKKLVLVPFLSTSKNFPCLNRKCASSTKRFLKWYTNVLIL